MRTADPQRRAAILQAAREVFAHTHYAETRLADIAKQAGVAIGTLYLYFESKEAMVEALADDYLQRQLAALLPSLSSANPRTFIAEAVHAALAFAAQERDLVRLLDLRSGLGRRGTLLPGDEQQQQLLVARFAELIASNQLYQYDPSILAALVSGIVEWTAKACLVWEIGTIEAYEPVLVQMLHHALLPCPQPQSVC